MSTAVDTTDARRLLTAESREALANNIRSRHERSMQLKEEGLTAVMGAINEAVETAKMVEAARANIGHQFAKWWREHDLPVGWASRYLKLAKTAGRNTIGDKDQLRLIGILPEAEGNNEGTRRDPNPFAWTRYAGKINASFTERSLRDMDDIQRRTALKHLEPIKAIIVALEALTGDTKGK